MMSPSPDPPRQQGSDELPESFANFGIFEVENEADIMGEGEHELDYSSHNESDFSDGFESDVDNENLDGQTQDHGTRGRYRVLIPFQVETVPSLNSDFDEDIDEESENPVPDQPRTDSIENLNTHDDTGNSQIQEPNREIIITEDKAEVIKNVMKQFTLPQSAIPHWAQEITEDSWKNKIKESLDQKNLPSANSSD